MTYSEFVAGRQVLNGLLSVVVLLAGASVVTWKSLPRRWRWFVPAWAAAMMIFSVLYFALK